MGAFGFPGFAGYMADRYMHAKNAKTSAIALLEYRQRLMFKFARFAKVFEKPRGANLPLPSPAVRRLIAITVSG